MKSFFLLASLALSVSASAASPQQADSTGMAGDDFDLRGALDLFRNAKDLEAFEKAVNTDANKVSNLDLDANGEVDYVHVHTLADGDARIVVLRVQVAKDDAQDVASIQMERAKEGAVTLQIRGDEALYPEGTIIEPSEKVKDGGLKGGGPLAPPAQITVWVDVWGWPCVQWCYGPTWWDWNSPWYYGYYPPWWRPWRPWGWNAWWGFPRPYWRWYHPVNVCRVERANNVYMHRRTVSPSFGRRSGTQPVRPGRELEKPMPEREIGRPVERERVKEPGTRPERKPATQPSKKPDRNVPGRTSRPSRQSPQKSPAPSRAPARPPSKR